MDAVRANHVVLMDAEAMSPSIRTIDGIEQLANAIKSIGLAQ
jgi:iron complex transport system substrate-binding protein